MQMAQHATIIKHAPDKKSTCKCAHVCAHMEERTETEAIVPICACIHTHIYELLLVHVARTWKSPAPWMVTSCDARRPAHRTHPDSSSEQQGGGAPAVAAVVAGGEADAGPSSAASTMSAGRWRRQCGRVGAGRSIRWRSSCAKRG